MTNVRHDKSQDRAGDATPAFRLRIWLLGLALVAVLAATACGQGAYPLDIFYEMHYQQTYKSQEPPRMSGVEGAVAWYPAQGATTTFGADGEYLFNVNCSMCHGAQAKGDGPVLQMLIDEYGYTPLVTPDLTSELVVTMGRGGMEGMMTSGLGVMPSFSKLLTPAERSAISQYIEEELQK